MTADLSGYRFRARRQSWAERPTGGAFSHSLSPKRTVDTRDSNRSCRSLASRKSAIHLRTGQVATESSVGGRSLRISYAA